MFFLMVSWFCKGFVYFLGRKYVFFNGFLVLQGICLFSWGKICFFGWFWLWGFANLWGNLGDLGEILEICFAKLLWFVCFFALQHLLFLGFAPQAKN